MPDRLGDEVRLWHILDAIASIEEYTDPVSFEGFCADKMRKDATLRQLEIIGEASNRISSKIKEEYSDIDWLSIVGLRNLVIHEYFGVDLRTIWNIVKNDIPHFQRVTETILEGFKYDTQQMTLTETNFNFPNQTSVYKGKVREAYSLADDRLVMIATDRLSAFDVVMPKGIPYKGQILNQIATKMMRDTEDLVPNWLEATPDPNVAIGKKCEPFKVEMVIRGYLSGHAAREYKAGKRMLCGVPMPEGMKENDKFPEPIITPATKAEQGDHDEDISREDILARGIVSAEDYSVLEDYTRKLFFRGSEIAKDRGLILVDTKYEFGKTADGKIVLIDEIHTPDSSRYFYADGYEERQRNGEPQRQLSKEFVRQWLISNGFQGLEGQTLPEMSDEYIETVSERYIELYENITGEDFVKADVSDIKQRIEQKVLDYLKED